MISDMAGGERQFRGWEHRSRGSETANEEHPWRAWVDSDSANRQGPCSTVRLSQQEQTDLNRWVPLPLAIRSLKQRPLRNWSFPKKSHAGRRSLVPASRETCLLGRDFAQFDSLSDCRHAGGTGARTMKVGGPHCDQGCLVMHASVYINLNLKSGPLDGLEGGSWLCVPLPSAVTSSTSFLFSSLSLV